VCVGWWSEMAWIIDEGLDGYGPKFLSRLVSSQCG